MNRIYRSIWNDTTGTFVAASEQASSSGKKTSSSTRAHGADADFALKALALSLLLSFGTSVHALPAGGVVAAGSASISSGALNTTVTQSTQNAAINWQSFNIGQTETVRFAQPNSNSVMLNRVLGSDPSNILGNLTANGKVFLVNPNGVLFGRGASVNVGGLVASTLAITDSDFMAGSYKFAGPSGAAVLNQGTINANGGYVALLGAQVGNDGVISAQLGTVALAAGQAVTLDVAGDGLLNVTVNQGALNALAQNGGLIRADGGQILLTAQSAGLLLQSAVNNTGVIQAQTLVTGQDGSIKLMGDMQSGTVNVAGRLDASAPNGGNGGRIETSAASVKIANQAEVTTAAATGVTGTWLIDPQDFTIGSGATDNIAGATLSALLVTNSVVIATNTGPNATVAGTPPVTSLNTATLGNGDIFVNDAVSWTATPSTTTLTLNAARDVNLNQSISATNGNLVVCCGRDVNVNAALTTTNGSILLAVGRNANLNAAMTTTDGNMMICAARDINVSSAITLTRGSSIPSQSLGLPLGLVLSAGTGGTGPGVGGGTVLIAPGTPPMTVTGPNAPVTLTYNPVSYAAPTDYLPNFTLTLGATLTQFMLVFPGGADKTFDASTTATFTGLKGAPAGVTLVAGPGSTATFDTAAVGTDKTVTFSGYSLGGANATNYALPVSCCAPVVRRTTASITPAIVVVPPPVVVLPPVEVPAPVEVPIPVVVPPPVAVPIPVVVPPPVEVPIPVVVAPPAEVPAPVVVAPPAAIQAPVPFEVAAPPEVPTTQSVVVAPLRLVIVPGRMPPELLSVVSAPLPAELRSVAPTQAPLVAPAPVAPPPVVRQPAPVPEQPYVAPVRPRKQDRN